MVAAVKAVAVVIRSTPTEADDTLQSIQFANVLDLLSEGEIQGLDDGNKSIFLTTQLFKTLTGPITLLVTPLLPATARKRTNHIPGPS